MFFELILPMVLLTVAAAVAYYAWPLLLIAAAAWCAMLFLGAVVA